jgi:CheY-like chemotaxis protein
VAPCPRLDITTPFDAPGTNRTVRVLIADDSRDAMLLLGILLRSEGYQVRLAQGGEDALAQAEEFRPHVALLDIEMPDRDGFQVAEELHRRFNGACPILIAVTACTDEKDRKHAAMSGFQHFVPKPYNHRALLRLLESLRP